MPSKYPNRPFLWLMNWNCPGHFPPGTYFPDGVRMALSAAGGFYYQYFGVFFKRRVFPFAPFHHFIVHGYCDSVGRKFQFYREGGDIPSFGYRFFVIYGYFHLSGFLSLRKERLMQGEIRTMQSLRQHCLRQVRGYDLSPQGTPLRWLFVAKIVQAERNKKLNSFNFFIAEAQPILDGVKDRFIN